MHESDKFIAIHILMQELTESKEERFYIASYSTEINEILYIAIVILI